MRFKDRVEAGQRLAVELAAHRDTDAVVLALPRGGVPVAFEVAKQLNLPLGLFLVRKLGATGQDELAIGAIASGGMRVLNRTFLAQSTISEEMVQRIIAREEAELRQHERLYSGAIILPTATARVALVVDDGLATGATMHAAVLALRMLGPRKIVVAVPIGTAEACDRLRTDADEVICLATPAKFFAVGHWYDDFSQTSDAEVRKLMDRAKQELPKAKSA